MLYIESSWADVAIKNAYIRGFKGSLLKEKIGDFKKPSSDRLRTENEKKDTSFVSNLGNAKSRSSKVRQPEF